MRAWSHQSKHSRLACVPCQAEASFALQYELIQSASADMEQVDLVAVQQLLRADEEAAGAHRDDGDGESEEEDNQEDDGTTAGAPTYEDLIELGRHIGDVKAERWAFR